MMLPVKVRKLRLVNGDEFAEAEIHLSDFLCGEFGEDFFKIICNGKTTMIHPYYIVSFETAERLPEEN